MPVPDPARADLVEDPPADQMLVHGHLLDEREERRELNIHGGLASIAGRLGTAQRPPDRFTGEMQFATDAADRLPLSVQVANGGSRFQRDHLLPPHSAHGVRG